MTDTKKILAKLKLKMPLTKEEKAKYILFCVKNNKEISVSAVQ